MKGQDILVLLKLVCLGEDAWTYATLAEELGMSASQVHAALKRCADVGLYNGLTRRPNAQALLQFLIHAVRYIVPVKPGPLVQGLPTSYAGPPLNKHIRFSESAVMPLAGGPARGSAVAPVWRTAPQAAQRDEKLYELLALVDALRMGRLRERKLAEKELEKRLGA